MNKRSISIGLFFLLCIVIAGFLIYLGSRNAAQTPSLDEGEKSIEAPEVTVLEISANPEDQQIPESISENFVIEPLSFTESYSAVYPFNQDTKEYTIVYETLVNSEEIAAQLKEVAENEGFEISESDDPLYFLGSNQSFNLSISVSSLAQDRSQVTVSYTDKTSS